MMATLYQLAHHIMWQFEADYIHVQDDSHRHHGHKGVTETQHTHFTLTIVSPAFTDRTLLHRHRHVYEVVSSITPAFQDKGLHALKLITKTPEEWYEQ